MERLHGTTNSNLLFRLILKFTGKYQTYFKICIKKNKHNLKNSMNDKRNYGDLMGVVGMCFAACMCV